MDSGYWDQRYKSNDFPWDIGYVSPPLKDYFDQLSAKSFKILIPGAGLGHEAIYLAESGFSDVSVCDISREALTRLEVRLGRNLNVKLLHTDFFDLKEKYDLVIEQTFFCAIDPGRRSDYVQKMFHTLNAGGKIAGVLFDKKFEHDGPPFGGDRIEYVSLFNTLFHIKLMDMCYNSIKPRQGSELFFICEKKLI